MKKIFLKRILPILLTVSVVFCFGSVVAFAVDPVTVYIVCSSIGSVIIGALASDAAMALAEEIAPAFQDLLGFWYEDLNSIGVNQLNMEGGYLYAYVNDPNYNIGTALDYTVYLELGEEYVNATPETQAMLEYVVEYYNNFMDGIHNGGCADSIEAGVVRGTLTWMGHNFDYNQDGIVSISTVAYCNLKYIVGNAFASYLSFLNANEEAIAKEEALLALQEAGKLYTFDFDFVGPLQPGITVPVSTSYIELEKDGFHYSVPRHIVGPSPYLSGWMNIHFMTEEECFEHSFTDIAFRYGNGYQPQINSSGKAMIYGYIIYDSHIYYAPFSNFGYLTTSSYYWYSPFWGNGAYSNADSVRKYILSQFYIDPYNKVGSLYDTDLDITNGTEWYYGVVINYDTADMSPFSTFDVNEDDFSKTTGGTVDIPYTDDEQLIVDGLGSGMVDVNDNISVDENGNITAVGGIMLETLDKLLNALKEGEIGLNSVQEYLETMVTLMSTAKVSDNERAKLLSNINANIATIAQAIEQSKEAEKENVDFSTLLIEHTGLLEAIQLKNNLGFVQQLELLWTNLIGGSFNNVDNVNAVPDFTFYWDSNNDGLVEAYNALDLSWLDTPLTNNNLADKGRFDYEVTARQFLQWFIVIVVYSLFAIKAIKLLPTLIGGAGEAQHDSNTINFVK